jgi:hypothetical protein
LLRLPKPEQVRELEKNFDRAQACPPKPEQVT